VHTTLTNLVHPLDACVNGLSNAREDRAIADAVRHTVGRWTPSTWGRRNPTVFASKTCRRIGGQILSSHRLVTRSAGLLVVASLALAACSSAGGSTAPSAAAPSAAAPSAAAPSAAASAAESAAASAAAGPDMTALIAAAKAEGGLTTI